VEAVGTAENSLLMRLLVSCPDRPGIVAAVARLLLDAGANIVHSDQYSTDPARGTFFLRMEFTLQPEQLVAVTERFGSIAHRFDMNWRLWDAATLKRVAILVSRYDHCLHELVYRWQRNTLAADIVLVGSNHPELREGVEAVGVPYHHVPVEKGHKPEAEARLIELLEGKCDVVVLARFMQILSGEFLERVGVPVINIHHSFLPAFVGAGPYEQAKARGVKLIGATAHYVTEDLDAGPIIEQDVVRVTHEQDVTQLTRMGAEIERNVLARAVQWHCEDRILTHGNTTIVL
jgi:formyltetrahydrofolate deformylase